MFRRILHGPEPAAPYDTNELAPLQPVPTSVDVPLEQSPSEDLTYWQKVRTLAGAGTEDYKKASRSQKLGLLATAGWLMYEWGPGNEAATPFIGGLVLGQVDGRAAPIATGVATGVFTYAQQRASGATTAYAATGFPRLANLSYSLVNQKDGDKAAHKDWDNLPKSTKWFYSFLIGSTFGVTREAAVTGDASFKHLEQTAHKNARISGTTVAAIGATAGGLKWATEGTPAEHTSDVIINVMENPLTWLGLFGSVSLAKFVKRRLSRD